MKDPIFLLQSGGPLATEKVACSFSCYPVEHAKLEDLTKFKNQEGASVRYVPVGSIEFVKQYCDVVGFHLPEDFSYWTDLERFLMRPIRKGTYKEASITDFVKPIELKNFTGNLKGHLEQESTNLVDPDTAVWVSPGVPFGAEFRFYILNRKIQGWSRYDDSNQNCPEPDVSLVEAIVEQLHQDIGPNAYTVDIGWRHDLGCYCLVELNDAWSLGFYENSDFQSNPPTRQQYADMLVARWSQIVFCNLV